MKKILLFSLILLGTVTQLAFGEKENSFALGFSGGVNNSPYIGAKNETYLLPALEVQYNNFYIQSTEIGYSFFHKNNFEFSLIGEAFNGYPIKGSKLKEGYKNISERKSQPMGGLQGTYSFPKNIILSGNFLFGEHGNKNNFTLLKYYQVSDTLSITPSIYGNIYSKNFTNYYFGVNNKDLLNNSSLTNTYSKNLSYGGGISLAIEKYLTENISIYSYGTFELLSKEIKNSPLVDKNYFWTLGTGIKYTF